MKMGKALDGINESQYIAASQASSCVLSHWKTGEDLVCQASWEKKVVE